MGWGGVAQHGMGLPLHLPHPTPAPCPSGICGQGGSSRTRSTQRAHPCWSPGVLHTVQTSLADTPRPSSPTSLLQYDLPQCCLGQGRAGVGGGCRGGLWALLSQHGALWCLPTPPVTLVPFGLPSPQEPPCEDKGGAPKPGPRGGAAHLGRAHPQQVHPGGLHRCPAQCQLPGAPR